MQLESGMSAIDRAWARVSSPPEEIAIPVAPVAPRRTFSFPKVRLPHVDLSPAHSDLLKSLAKKLIAIAISYELTTYFLATVQAVGLTLPAMVNSGPAESKLQCQKNMARILSGAEEWKRTHPGILIHRPRIEELGQYLGTLPKCPDGGTYEMVYPGHMLATDTGQRFLVLEGRVAVRCDHRHEGALNHGGMMSNPFDN